MNRKRSRRSQQRLDRAPRTWRLPPLPISKPAAAGALSAAAVFVAAAIALPPLWAWFKGHPFFALTSVEVEGNLRTSDDEVVRLAGIRPGQSIWDVSARSVVLRAETHPWIHRAEMRIEASGRAVIRVRERTPIAIVRFDQLHYVDRRGHVLGPLNPEDSRNFPIITGLEKDAQRAFAPVALPRTAQLLRWCERRGTIDQLSEVRVDREAGITMFPADVNVAVELGWGRWREKLGRSARVFTAWQGHLDRLVAIDVSLPETVIVRMRDGERKTGSETESGRRI